MKKNPNVAIVGATGVVGHEMLTILEEKKIAVGSVRLFASKGSVGEVYRYGDQELIVEELNEGSFEEIDVALFALGAELAEKYIPIATEAGAVVIDNSSHFRMKEEIPLIVPEVNFEAIGSENRIIANPNCSTIQLVPILSALHQLAGLKRVVVSTYQAVSGAGKHAMDELFEQTRAVFAQSEYEKEAFAHPIAFNCIPQIDVMLENGYTKEEFKIINESRKILGIPDLRITATAVRVPVFHGHAESVNVETERPFELAQVLTSLEAHEGVTVHPNHMDFPMQLDVAGDDAIHVGRVRRDESVENGLDLWIVADNIRKGAALNAVQIFEKLLD
jgi:aspartate-semialdehyde dehydrogenase